MKYFFLITLLSLLLSCEAPKQNGEIANDSLQTNIILDEAQNRDSSEIVEPQFHLWDSLNLALEKGKSDLYAHYIDSAEFYKLITVEEAKKYKQAIKILKLSNYDKVYHAASFFVTQRKITDSTFLFGFYSSKGTEIMKPQFDGIEPVVFSPLFLGIKNNQEMLIDESGKVVLSNYEILYAPDEKTFILIKNKQGKYGYFNIDKQKIVIKAEFDTLGTFGEDNKTIASKSGKKFYIDRTGKTTTPPKF